MDEMTPDQKRMLKAYISRRSEDAIREYGDKPIANDFTESLFGNGKFRDSGRASSGMGESLDSLVGAPARQGISKLQDGEPWEAIKATLGSIGKDPSKAPTGVDIAMRATDNPYLGTALATAVDVGAQLPMPVSPGIAGKISKVGADDVLAKVKTAEQAVALKGAEREEYLKALDEKFGARDKRRAEMGFGKNKWFHGTGSDIDKFDMSLKKTNAGGPTGDHAIHFAKDPKLASQYAHEQSPEWYRRSLAEDNRLMKEAIAPGAGPEAKKRFKDYAEGPRKEYEAKLKELPEGYQFESGNNVLPVNLKTKQMSATEMDGGSLGYDEAALLKMTKDEGKYGGVVFKNAYDNLNHTRFENPDLHVQSTDVAAVFSPKDIRSVNAAFDPRFKDSDLLLAGHAGVSDSRMRAIDKMLRDENEE